MGMALGEAATFSGQPANRNVFVNNIPVGASWQDLKDLMRGAGEVIRADVGMTADGRPKGNGTVAFVDAQGAANAIRKFNGYDWAGSVLEVREDRFAAMPGRGAPVRGGPPVRGMRGMPRGGFGRGFGPGFGGGLGPGFQQGFGGGYQQQQGFQQPMQQPMQQFSGAAAAPAAAPATNGAYAPEEAVEAAPESPQIWVGNVSATASELTPAYPGDGAHGPRRAVRDGRAGRVGRDPDGGRGEPRRGHRAV
jgi:RNA recognition motif-containing protein